jgi:hypothetical protein
MDFKLNKVDMELRYKINEERSEDKVHNKKGININKDKNKDEKKEYPEQKKEGSKEGTNTTETVENEPKPEDPYRGHFIDTRK